MRVALILVIAVLCWVPCQAQDSHTLIPSSGKQERILAPFTLVLKQGGARPSCTRHAAA